MKRIFIKLAGLLLLTFSSQPLLADSFESLIMPGPVIEGHAKYEQECSKCHDVLDKSNQKRLCLDCHKDINKDISRLKGYHGKNSLAKKADCHVCHIEHKGRKEDIIKLDTKTFQHDYTDFRLLHSHKKVECRSCHLKNKKYREAEHQCYSCHKKNDIHKGKLGKECSRCHNEKSWSDISFDHSKTDFSLTGKHKKTTCSSCHINNRFAKTPDKCVSCHHIDDVHQGKNGKQCNKCHNSRSWKSLKFDHDKDTDFKLTGRHKKQACNRCHRKNPYKHKIKKTCISCHTADDKHNGDYGTKCHDCHNTVRWSQVKFDHDRDTEYALTGKHKKTKCISCHSGHLYKEKLTTECKTCHKNDDVHKFKNKAECTTCHTTNNWQDTAKFDHDLTGFPLLGLHSLTACEDCHLSRQFGEADKECIKCHLKDDVHKKRLGKKCEQCHTPNDWKVWRFDHNKDTNFILDGAHKDLNCYRCHKDPVDGAMKTGQTCGSCHADDDFHNNQFGQRCEECHTTTDFSVIHMDGF